MKGVMRGSGTQADPYLVEDEIDLNEAVRIKSKSKGIYYKQIADIDLSSIADSNYFVEGFEPITRFNGIYDGNNKAIRNMQQLIKIGNTTGVFGTIGATGEVYNLKVMNVNIEIITKSLGESVYCGGLVGYIEKDGKVYNCEVQGKVTCNRRTILNNDGAQTSDNHVGGVIGYSNSDIDNVKFKGEVTGYGGYIGGVIGRTYNKLVSNCKSDCSLLGYKYIDMESAHLTIGGIVGVCNNTDYCTIKNCISKVVVRGEANVIGGVGGQCRVIEQSCALIDIECNNSLGTYGGLCGYVFNTVKDCYVIGTIQNKQSKITGGLVGSNSVLYPGNIDIINSYVCVECAEGLTDILLGSVIGHCEVSVMYNGDKYGLSSNTYNRETEQKMLTKELYTGYNSLYKMTSRPLDTIGVDGDIVYTDDSMYYANSSYIGTIRVYKSIVYTKQQGTWVETVVDNIDITSDSDSIIDSITNLDTENGLISMKRVLNNETFRIIYHYINNNGAVSYTEVYRMLDINYTYLFIYDSKNRYINRKLPTETFNYNNGTYYIETVFNSMNYDFTNIWGIDPDINYGYPYLLGLDYSDLFDDIFDDILTYIRVQVAGRIVTIPVYPDTGTDKLVVNTHKGLGSIKLVDVDDSKATPIRIKLQTGIKSLSE